MGNFWAGFDSERNHVDHDGSTWECDDFVAQKLSNQWDEISACQGGQDVKNNLPEK